MPAAAASRLSDANWSAVRLILISGIRCSDGGGSLGVAGDVDRVLGAVSAIGVAGG